MPLINGLKMACEPCIRGHRSTKCTHANERLMVPVRKPGRPLSSCPHPAARPCSCAAVTAAIPKKHKCHCGPSQSSPAGPGPKVEKESSSAAATPPSPSPKGTTSSSAHRVQKSTSKNGPGRKPIDPTGLERMDPSQLNILPPFDPGQQKPTPGSNSTITTMPSMPGYGVMGFIPSENPFNAEAAVFSMFQQPMLSPIINPTTSGPSTNGHYPSRTNGLIGSGTNLAVGGCCGGGKATQAQPNTPQIPKTNGIKKEEPKSCCASAAESPEVKPQEELITAPEAHPQASGIMMPAFQTPIAMPSGMYPYFAQPTVFAYPPQYGSYLQPLQPEQWRQLMTTTNIGNPVVNATYSVPAAMPLPQSNAWNEGSWTSHQCSCGESCQCIGCATHPYNQATQNYVRSAWNTVMGDSTKKQNHTNGNHSMINGNHDASSSQTPSGIATPVMNKNEGNVSPTAAQTPSDTASGIGEDQMLSESDFFFVSYPFGDSCEGEIASCPCGDDCQCIGCTIHNNPGPMQPEEAF